MESANELIPYLSMLSESDKGKYEELRKELNNGAYKYNRFQRLATFQLIMDKIRNFIDLEDADAWKRKLCCGVCWIEHDLALNARQLKSLTGKSKSTINGALVKLGYSTVKPLKEDLDKLYEQIPYIRWNYSESRMWSIRKKQNVKQEVLQVIASPVFNLRTVELNEIVEPEQKEDLFDIDIDVNEYEETVQDGCQSEENQEFNDSWFLQDTMSDQDILNFEDWGPCD